MSQTPTKQSVGCVILSEAYEMISDFVAGIAAFTALHTAH